jgi:hypothetical protein
MKRFIRFAIISLSLAIFSCQQNTNSPNNPSNSSSPVSSSNPSSPTTSNSEFKYVGQSLDKTSSGAAVVADGKNDMQFSYSHNFTSEVEVKEITITRLESGKPYGVAGWTSSLNKYWVLAVEANEKMINTSKGISLGKLVGNVNFNFYGSESGAESFNLKMTGTEYQLDIKYISGDKEETITKTVKL